MSTVEFNSFEDFMKKADRVLIGFCGMSSADLPDALWMDLYKRLESGLSVADFKQEVLETMADADEDFAALMEES